MMEEILDVALGQLALTGAPGLSLRAVAREIGLAPSALYRYVDSRDALLTALIVRGYDDLASGVEARESVVARDDLRGRFLETARAIRGWARAHPHHYALLYGSPVPGYAAPPDTIAPATRVAAVMARVLHDATASGHLGEAGGEPSGAVEGEALADFFAGVDPRTVDRAILAWASIYGLVSFELFGHLVSSVSNGDLFFDASLEHLIDLVGIDRRG
jgi:AcrR family transcriptional regulator